MGGSHPGDTRVPFTVSRQKEFWRCAYRRAGLRENGQLRFQSPAGGKVILAVAATDDRDTPAYFQSSLSDLQRATPQTVSAAWTQHVAWWQSFWSKSFIEIPDKTVQSWWYGSLYVLAPAASTGTSLPGFGATGSLHPTSAGKATTRWTTTTRLRSGLRSLPTMSTWQIL